MAPTDWLPVWCENEHAASPYLNAVPRGFKKVEECCAACAVFAGTPLDFATMLNQDCGGSQQFVWRIDIVGNVVQASASATAVMHHGNIMRQIRDAEPGAAPLSILPFNKISVLNTHFSCDPLLFAGHIVDHHMKMVKTRWCNAVQRIFLWESRQCLVQFT